MIPRNRLTASVLNKNRFSIPIPTGDTVILAHGKNRREVAAKLTEAMAQISGWLSKSCLTLFNISNTASMYFYNRKNGNQPYIIVNGERIQTVSHFKYIGIMVESQLSFKKYGQQVCNRVTFNLRNFRHIRNQLPLDAAKLYMHSMIFSHISYCITSWSQNGKTTLAPLQTLCKQTLKVLDKKPLRYHHCNIIQRHNLMTFESFVFLADVCLFSL